MQDVILDSYLKGFSADHGYEREDQSQQFELFSTYCVVCHGRTDKFDVERSAIGGGGDGGIDAIAILVNGSIFYDQIELEDFIKNNEKINVQFIFIQSKTSPSFESGNILKFGHGIFDFFKEESSLVINDDMKKFKVMKEIIYRNARKFYFGNPACYIYYVSTGEVSEDKNLDSVRKTIEDNLFNSGILSDVKMYYFGCKDLYKMYLNIIRGSEKEIRMEHYIVLPEVSKIDESILGRLKCSEFLKLICDDYGCIDKNIFSDNIRDFLGNTSINDEIRNTISDNSKKAYFTILNNGITAVARKIRRVNDKLIIENLQIVNGCQTSNVIYGCRKSISDDMYVPIKIISTESQEVINMIIKSTNRQNNVLPEAFESLTEFHRRFEEFCKAKSNSVAHKLYYERRSRQYATDNTIRPIDIITLSNLLSVSVSMFFEEPHSVHRYYGELLHANKNRLFLDNHAMEPYFFAGYCFRKITMELRRDSESKKYSIARQHALMYIWKILTNGVRYELNSRRLCKVINESMLKIIDDRNKFMSLCMDGIALFFNISGKSNIDWRNVARRRDITSEMIREIDKKIRR